MNKQVGVNIPESLADYEFKLFWGLTLKQIFIFVVVIFSVLAILFFGSQQQYFTAFLFFPLIVFLSLFLVERKGKTIFDHMVFLIKYYKKPQILLYHHNSDLQDEIPIIPPPERINFLLLILVLVIILSFFILIFTKLIF